MSAAHRIVRVAVAAEVRGADPAVSIAPLVQAWCHRRLPLLRRTSQRGERLHTLLASNLEEIAGQVTGQRSAAAIRAAAAQIMEATWPPDGSGRYAENARRYSCGLTPRERPKWWRRPAAFPNPTSAAIQSTECSVRSSSSSATRIR